MAKKKDKKEKKGKEKAQEPVTASETQAAAGPREKMSRKDFEAALEPLQAELVKMQEWIKVFDWLHLPFDVSVERFLNESSRPAIDLRRLMGRKYSYFSVQRGEKSPLESWRNDLTADEIKEVMSIVMPHFPVEQYWPDALC